MKKIISILFAGLLAVGLVACQKGNTVSPEANNDIPLDDAAYEIVDEDAVAEYAIGADILYQQFSNLIEEASREIKNGNKTCEDYAGGFSDLNSQLLILQSTVGGCPWNAPESEIVAGLNQLISSLTEPFYAVTLGLSNGDSSVLSDVSFVSYLECADSLNVLLKALPT